MESKKDMIAFLSGHFRYSTMNSGNGSSSYAANVKIGRRQELKDLDNAHDMLEMEEAFDGVNDLIEDFNARHNYQYQIGFNGRSDGYMVLYRGGVGSRIIYPRAGFGKDNNYKGRQYSDRFGWLSLEEAEARALVDYRLKTTHTMPGQSIGNSDPAEYAEMEMYNLREEVKLVKDFDKTVAACCRAFADFCRDNQVEEVEVMIPKKVKRIK